MMRHVVSGSLPLLFLALVATPAQAQEQEAKQEERGDYQPAAHGGMDAMMEAWQKAGAPGEPHEELAASVGTWETTVRWWMDPSSEPMVSTGTARREMIFGGRYLRETFEGQMMGEAFTGQGINGYNNVTGEYESIWIDNMSTGIYTYRGQKEDGRLVLRGEYKDPVSGQVVKTKGIVETVSDSEEKYTSYEERNGEMVKVMEIVYRRTG